MNKDILLVSITIEDYRYYFLQELVSRLGERLTVVTGDRHFTSSYSVGTLISDLECVKIVKNKYALNNQLLFQRQTISKMLKADVLVFEFNPRFVNLWIAVLLRKFLRKRSVGWGHVYSRAGESSKTNILRKTLRCISDGSILYTLDEQDSLRRFMPYHSSWVAPNALYSAKTIESFDDQAENRNDIVFISRLVPEKNCLLALTAIKYFKNKGDWKGKLLIGGQGPMEDEMRKLIIEHSLESSVEWVGRKFKVEDLSALYARSFAAINPGYIGLSIVQASSFGVPIVFPRNMSSHAPEIELAIEGVNAFPAENASAVSLGEALYRSRIEYESDPVGTLKRCRDAVLEKHCVESMVTGFVDAVENEAIHE